MCVCFVLLFLESCVKKAVDRHGDSVLTINPGRAASKKQAVCAGLSHVGLEPSSNNQPEGDIEQEAARSAEPERRQVIL